MYKSPAELSGQEELPIYEVYRILYENTRVICDMKDDKVLDRSKYVRLAKRYKYRNYRLLLYKDINAWGLSGSFTKYQQSVFSESGASVIIMNTMNEKPISMIIRSTVDKVFLNYSMHHTIYGYDMIDSNFKYGDWLVITEGAYDADSLRQVYPNVVATLTSNVTVDQTKVLKYLTDKFIIAYDSDSAGDSGFQKVQNRLGKDGLDNVRKLKIYSGDKDVGVMDEMFESHYEEYERRFRYYSKELGELLSMPVSSNQVPSETRGSMLSSF